MRVKYIFVKDIYFLIIFDSDFFWNRQKQKTLIALYYVLV